MKSAERRRRSNQRQDEWENVRQLCVNGRLPGESRSSRYRSDARRQSREQNARDMSILPGRASDGGSGGASNGEGESDELFNLQHFPFSPLSLEQVERSLFAFEEFAHILGAGPDSISIVHCEGEADVEVARASAEDHTGDTYLVGNDSDFLVYGFPDREESFINSGEVRYIPFDELDCSGDVAVARKVMTRRYACDLMGLPDSRSMIELGILLSNDYTRSRIRCEDMKKQKAYWKSLRWRREVGGEGREETEALPLEDEMDRHDVDAVAQHVGEKVCGGWALTSTDPSLRLAIDYSYRLYSFGDVSSFPDTVPDESGEEEEKSDGHEDEEEEPERFPTLPPDFDISLAGRMVSPIESTSDFCESTLMPLTRYKDNVQDNDDMHYIEQRHVDAFRMTVDLVMFNKHHTMEFPANPLGYGDLQALHVLERCLVESTRRRDADRMPSRVFDRSLYHSCLEVCSVGEAEAEKAPADDTAEETQESGVEEHTVLPIDEHEGEILRAVRTQRITIIHGETGCGKSSRVPCMLLRASPPEPTATAPEVKMIVSQPRRIAAKALAERVRSCEPDLADKIGLRMGHGIREYETKDTRAWFVTTGYVVRLLANHPGWFDTHSHLIIDEVHERSVDTDILCLLCRRLLNSHPTIRLVLMSATMAAELYQQYFGVPQPPIHVGARRFPIKEYFVEELASALYLGPRDARLATDIYKDCERSKAQHAPSNPTMDKLHNLAASITASVGGHGSSVLIFVPGMSDIEAISDRVDCLNVPGVEFVCLPIHSDVPFEEQMAAFEPPGEGEVKVIIATNAAESSVTLPDVDHVICLGLCKQIMYNNQSHRQMLSSTWISRASATQRAGRTGRVRPGNVYRLYSRNCFKHYMDPYESGEMVRIPLDQVILSLRDMMNEAVTPILLDCLEPPDVTNIERSFESLHTSNFITDASDQGEITSLGGLVVALGIDLALGALVGLGIQFGVPAEAIELAAILSMPKTPWKISSPMYHSTDQFNEIVTETFASRCFFDFGSYSEPLAAANLLHDFRNASNKSQFCWKHSVNATRMKHVSGSARSIRCRVAEKLNIRSQVLEANDPPYRLPAAKILILRLLQVWLFHDTLVENVIGKNFAKKNKIERIEDSLAVELKGQPIRREHLEQVLDPDKYSFDLITEGNISQNGTFGTSSFRSNPNEFMGKLEIRFTSYILDKKIELGYIQHSSGLKVVVPVQVWEAASSSQLQENLYSGYEILSSMRVRYQEVANKRGIHERSCGLFQPVEPDGDPESEADRMVFVISIRLTSKQQKKFKAFIDSNATQSRIQSIVGLRVNEPAGERAGFTVFSSIECTKIANQDLKDMFASLDLRSNIQPGKVTQKVVFHHCDTEVDDTAHPLVAQDTPRGLRLLSVLASERRRDNFIRLSSVEETDVPRPTPQEIDINIPRALSINNGRWRMKSGGGMAFVPANSIPSSCLPLDEGEDIVLFACCANTLELKGGSFRVEGLTLLPPGKLWVGLALLTFGIHPKTGLAIVTGSDAYNESKPGVEGLDGFVEEVWKFLKGDRDEETGCWRVIEALGFHESCMDMGESLQCQPNKIEHICEIFNGLNGEDIECWEGYDVSLQKQNEAFADVPTFTESAKLKKKRQQRKNNRKAKDVASTLVRDNSSLSIEEARKLLQPHIKPKQTNPHKSNAGSKKKKKAKKKKQSKNVSVNQADIDTDDNGNTGLDILSLCGT